MTRHAAWLALGFMLLPVTVEAQPADSRLAAGRISGQVVSAETGAPLAHATINLSGTAVAAAGRALARTTIADEDGAFDFPDLPAGDFALRASRPGYQLAGARRTGSLAPALRVSLTAGGSVELAVPMDRAGAIVGRIVDEFGEPVANLQVHALRWSYDADGRRAVLSAGVGDLTDDLGQFRVYGLPSGDYAVVATGRDPAGLMASFNPYRPQRHAAHVFSGHAEPGQRAGRAARDRGRSVGAVRHQPRPGGECHWTGGGIERVAGLGHRDNLAARRQSRDAVGKGQRRRRVFVWRSVTRRVLGQRQQRLPRERRSRVDPGRPSDPKRSRACRLSLAPVRPFAARSSSRVRVPDRTSASRCSRPRAKRPVRADRVGRSRRRRR